MGSVVLLVLLACSIAYYAMRNKFSILNLWNNKFLLLSGSAVICLFGFFPSKLSVGLGICALLALILWCSVWKNDKAKNNIRISAVLLGIACDFLLVSGFINIWSTFREVAALAGIFHLSARNFLLIIGLLGGLIAFNFLYFILSFVIIKARKIFEFSFETDKRICVKNIRSNWYISISALVFFCLESQADLAYYIGVIIAFLCIVLITSQKYRIFSIFKNEPWPIKIYAALSALGICFAGKRAFFNSLVDSKTAAFIHYSTKTLYLLSILCAVGALIFAYLFVIAILGYVRQKIGKMGTFKRISHFEWIVYGVVFVCLFLLTFTAFTQSQAFYGTEYDCNVIYTSDSPILVKNTADLHLSYAENDLRQPLFAVFAAPFTGGMYLVASLFSEVFHISDGLFYSMENIIQIALMLLGTILLVDLLELKKEQRICFFIALCSSYTMLLSSLMMEQYIVAYFWLVFAFNSAKTADKQDAISYCGAAGTLLPSGIIFPIFRPKKENESWKTYLPALFETAFKAVMGFLVLLIIFSRFDVIYTLSTNIYQLNRFTGALVSTVDKFRQYFTFVANCFIAPTAGIDTVSVGHISWQLAPVTSLNIFGVIIFALSAISFFVKRKDAFARLAGYWAFFSFLILFVIGWGTYENGLILYSLYFCWAFYVLLFKLIDAVCAKIKAKYLTSVISLICCVIMLFFNIPGIHNMISFAITYYPA